MIISTTSRTVFVAPTSGRARLTKPAAYREEARARFEATCDCDDFPPCRYHDRDRWQQDPTGYSTNGRIVARWAALLAFRDGVTLPHPPDPWRAIVARADARNANPDDDDLPF